MRLDGQTRRRISLALMVASGFAGLGYQIVWTQQASLWLGHEAAAILAVVAAFFGGLSLGAFALGDRIERSDRPLGWYVACEMAIAMWSLVLLATMPAVSAWALATIGERPTAAWQWTIAFATTFAMLLPATVAMGATLPAIERAMASPDGDRRSIAPHYAANTFGAVVGVLATAFWLIPELGLARTAAVCVGLNLLCAGVAWRALPGPVASTRTVGRPDSSSPSHAGATLARLAWTGLLGIGYEAVVVRVLGEVAEDTVYTFALLLAVYLVASALGAAAYARRGPTARSDAGLGDRLAGALALACLAGTATLWVAESLRDGSRRLLGDGMVAALGTEAVLAIAAFALPAFAMGAVFSHLTRQASAEGASFGRALGFNTLGAALAPPLFGVLLAPTLGAKATLLLVALGYVATATRQARTTSIVLVPAGLAAALAVAAPRLAFVDVPDGGHIVRYEEGATAAVSVVADELGVLRLRIDNRQQEGSSATRYVDARQAMLPMLLHPHPRRALFLGLGTGITASSAAEDAEVDAVELLPEVVAASRSFTEAFHDGTPNPRLHLVVADARRYVRVASARYDVVVADNFHPARSGSGALYTVEHFAAVRERLAPGGLFCQWLPLHQLDLETVRSIVRSFRAVYPDGWAVVASLSLQTPVIGLVARRDGGRFEVAALRARLELNRFAEPPAAFGIDDELSLLGSFIAGPRALARFSASAPANTDDRPIVAYRAPRITYAPDSLPADRLSALLHELWIDPFELMEPGAGAEWARRVSAYDTARDRFVDAGRGIVASPDVEVMLSRVRDPLLAILRTSPEFRPAYAPLLRMASSLSRRDPEAARTLLDEMSRIQPDRLEARALRESLGAIEHGPASAQREPTGR